MTTVTYSFEGGTNGSNVAQGTGAGPGDTSFDNVFIGSGATDIYDSTRAAHGTQSDKIAAPSTTSTYNAWTTSVGTQTTVWVRAYLFFTAAPSVQHRVINMVGSAASRGNILATTSGTLIFTNSGGGTVLTSAAFPAGNWFRLEAMFTGSATAGQWQYKIWYQPDAPAGSTPSDTQTSAANLNTGGTTDTYRFGIGSNPASTAGPFWIDDVGVSTTGFIGPAAAQVPAPPQQPRIPRRASARGFWKQPAPPASNAAPQAPGAADVFPHLTVARRYPARGWFAAGAGPGNAVPGTQPWVPKPSVSRRAPARGAWRGVTPSASNAVSGTVQPAATALPRQHAAQRAIWRGNPVAARQPRAATGGLVRRGSAARAVWAAVAGVLNAGGPAGTAQPRATVPVPRRPAARAVRESVLGPANAHGPAGSLQPRLTVARRAAARAVARWAPVATANAAPAAPARGTAQPPATAPRRPRAAQRVIWRGQAVPGTRPQPAAGGLVRRRSTARGQWHGNAGAPPPAGSPGIPATGGRVVTRRPPGRGLWHGNTGPANAHGPAVPAPKTRPRITSRAASRAVISGTVVSAADNRGIPGLFSLGQALQTWTAGHAQQAWATGTAKQTWSTGQARNG